MFYVKEPSSLGAPWVLSHYDNKVVAISKDTTNDLKNYHILGIDFLYQNYKKQFKGAILNEEDGLNVHLQVAAFLNAMYKQIEQKFLVLIVTPDDLIVNWHYHLTRHGGLKVQIVMPQTCPADFDQEHGLALLLGFSNIRLAEYLIDYDYFSVVIDNFDEIATKVIIRKLCGSFNVGLTLRNFYIHPNQKLQWTMLNWSNPGCVGKLADFYEIDNDNFANFRDNYRHWWFRLTWNFCESFKKQTEQERQEYLKTLSKWAVANHIKHAVATKIRKRKKLEIVKGSLGNDDEQKIKRVEADEVINKVTKDNVEEKISDNRDIEVKSQKLNCESSEDTIIYEYEEVQKKERDPNYVELPSMDENPILNSIIRNLETSPEPITPQHNSYGFTPKYDLERPTCSKTLEDNEVLMSIIDDTLIIPTSSVSQDHETQVSFKKEELLSQIFSDDPCTSKSLLQTEEDSEFFRSLVGKDHCEVKKSSIKKQGKCDIDDILKETEILLRE